jgi:hypothetical protein
MARGEHPDTTRWRTQAELHGRQVQDLMFQNAQLVVLVGALLPGLWASHEPRCISCGITLGPRDKKYCSQKCNQRAWRARKAAA